MLSSKPTPMGPGERLHILVLPALPLPCSLATSAQCKGVGDFLPSTRKSTGSFWMNTGLPRPCLMCMLPCFAVLAATGPV